MQYVISSGVTETLNIGSSDQLSVLDGGRSLSSTVDGGQIDVLSGGVAQSDLIEGFGFELVSSGGRALDETLSGGSLTVASGGVASAVNVVSGDVEVQAGGSVLGTVLSALPYAEADQGVQGVASATVIGDGGLEFVESGGRSLSAAVTAFGEQQVASKGLASGTQVSSGGFLSLVKGADARDVVVSSGGFAALPKTYVDAGQHLAINSGVNTIDDTDFLSGADFSLVADVRSGGYVSVDGSTPGLVLDIGAGAVASIGSGVVIGDASIAAGGRLAGAGVLDSVTVAGLLDRATVSGSTLYAEGRATVRSGGSAHDVTVEADELVVSSGGRASGTVLSDYALMLVRSGASAQRTIVGATASAFVSDGAVAQDAIVLSGGLLTAAAGADVSGATVASGGTLVLDGGDVSAGALVSSGGHLKLPSAILSAGVLTITEDGLAVGTELAGVALRAGAQLKVAQIAVSSGATLSITSGAAVDAVVVSKGGVLTGTGKTASVTDDGLVSGVKVEGSNLDVAAGGQADAISDLCQTTTVQSGGLLANSTLAGQVIISGEAQSDSLASGSMTIGAGGMADDIQLGDGAEVTVSSGGLLNGTTPTGPVTTSDAVVEVLSGGFASALSITAREEAHVEAGGTASASVVQSGGELLVSQGGLAVDAVVAAGGVGEIKGVVTGGQVLSGGWLDIGKVTSQDVGLVSSGGGLEIDSYEVRSDSNQSVGPVEVTTSLGGFTLLSGATLELGDVDVDSGGTLTITSGGSAVISQFSSGSVVVDNGSMSDADLEFGSLSVYGTLSGSGTISGSLIVYGDASHFSGTADIVGHELESKNAGDLGQGNIVFGGGYDGSLLVIDSAAKPRPGSVFSDPLVDFSGNDQVDIENLAYTSGATATVSGDHLDVKDGNATYTFILSGTIASSYTVTGSGHTLEIRTDYNVYAADPLIEAAGSFQPLSPGPAGAISGATQGQVREEVGLALPGRRSLLA